MDDRHWLIWTSRPAPLKAGLGRIHREHGVERFPQPAEIHVDASELDIEEKASILFRHARSRRLTARGVELVRTHAWTLVDHPHFTPERIPSVGPRISALTASQTSPRVTGASGRRIEQCDEQGAVVGRQRRE
jgi:hypothetical protein